MTRTALFFSLFVSVWLSVGCDGSGKQVENNPPQSNDLIAKTNPPKAPKATKAPTPEVAPSSGPTLRLFVDKKGDVDIIVDVELEGDTIAKRLKSLHVEAPNANLSISHDPGAPNSRLLEVVDAAKAAGFKYVKIKK